MRSFILPAGFDIDDFCPQGKLWLPVPSVLPLPFLVLFPLHVLDPALQYCVFFSQFVFLEFSPAILAKLKIFFDIPPLEVDDLCYAP